MNVLEIKNNLLKISYDVNENLALAGFVIIEDSNSPYVGQIMNLKSEGDSNYAIVKLLFTFNEDGILKNYNGTIPSTNATVSKLPANELLDVIPKDNPLFVGILAQQEIPLLVDKSMLDNNLLICSDNLENTFGIVDCISKQIEEKLVIIDTDGQYDYSEKLVPGVDFKIPLNENVIDYIYENDLKDIDPVNKAVIQDILIEVQNYIKSLPENFLPFDMFLNVIDSQYQETKIPELILLKNKLLKYKELNIFAQNLKESLSFSIFIEQEDISVIDLSVVDSVFKKEIIRFIYSVIKNINEKIYVLIKVNNDTITKRLLKLYLEKGNVSTIVICPHEMKYIEEAKEASQNVIFFAPLTVSHDFASYNTYLGKLNADEFVIYGANTQNIPLIVEVSEYTDEIADSVQTESEDLDNDKIEDVENILDDSENIFAQNSDIENAETASSETDVYDELLSENENAEPEIAEEVSVENNELDDISVENDELHDISVDESNDESLSINNEIPAVDNILELEDSDSQIIAEPLKVENGSTDTVITELPEEQYYDDSQEEETLDTQDEVVEQVVKDVDRAFYEKLPEDDGDFISIGDEISSEDELTEDDLNVIDDLTSDDIALMGDSDEESTIDILPEEENPPVVPIYPADDIEEKDGLTFEPGEKVTTAKYGDGIVEKMIKYGNKMLCSINFPSIGRRLLDPAITEITRIQ